MRGIDNLYGDGTQWNYKDYKSFLENNNNIYNLHNTLLQLTNHILDGNAEILKSWKNISKLSIQGDTKWIKDEIHKVGKLEEEIQNYNKLMKEYLFKIEKLFKNNNINNINKNINSNNINNINENNENNIKSNNKIINVVLKILTIVIIILIFNLIDRKTNVVQKIKKSLKKIKKSLKMKKI